MTDEEDRLRGVLDATRVYGLVAVLLALFIGTFIGRGIWSTASAGLAVLVVWCALIGVFDRLPDRVPADGDDAVYELASAFAQVYGGPFRWVRRRLSRTA